MKYKVGYQQVEQDQAVIRAARSEASDLQVMVDYNQSLSVAEAIQRIQFLEEEALVWVKSPLVPMTMLVTPESQPIAKLPFRSAKTSGVRMISQRASRRVPQISSCWM